jgi:hypothetical protein
VSVIGVPLANCPEQEAPQSMPAGLEVIVPVPFPAFAVVRPEVVPQLGNLKLPTRVLQLKLEVVA